MKIKRRTKIISETERQFSISFEKKVVRFFCPRCDGQAEMLSINEAAQKMKIDWRAVVHMIDDRLIHSTETASGEIYVCAASILKLND